MRTTRKLLALLLAVAMVFTMTAMTALATGGDDGTTTPNGGTPTTPDGGDPATPGGGTTTPGGGPTTPGDPATPGDPTTPGDPATPEVPAEAQAVINLIAALPTSDTILADMEAGTFDVEAYKAQVSAAWAAYDKLTEEQKVEVMNIANLTRAEADLALLESINPLGDENVCAIGSIEYSTLQEAVEKVQDGGTATITMLTDAEVTQSISIGNKKIILDLKGNTISANTEKVFQLDSQSSKLTITDSSDTRGRIQSSEDYMFFVTAGTLEIQKGIIRSTGHWESGGKPYGNTIVAIVGSTNPADKDYSVFKLGKDAILQSAEATEGGASIGNGYAVEIQQNDSAAYGVKVEINGQIDHAILYTNGNIQKEENAPQITLGSNAVIDGGVYAAGYADWIVDGAKITGSTAFEIRAGSLTVNSGTFIGTGTPIFIQPNGNGSTTDGVGIAIAQHTTKLPIYVTINEGEISGYTALYESNPQKNEEDDIAKVTIQIKGGTFTANGPDAASVYSENKTGFITGGKFSTDVKEYITDRYDQLVTNNETDTPFWVGKYNDSGAADAMGQTVYKVTYKFDGKSVDVYYMTEEAAKDAIKEAEEEDSNITVSGPAAVKPTPSGGGGGSGSYLPVILSPVWNQTVSVIEHGTLTMSVWASRASSYQWYVDRGDGRFVAIAGATGDSLTIWPDMGDNGNRYYCRAMNGYGGVDSHYFTLCVVRSTLPPKTGDQVCVTLWVCLMALGVAGALTAWNRQRNR